MVAAVVEIPGPSRCPVSLPTSAWASAVAGWVWLEQAQSPPAPPVCLPSPPSPFMSSWSAAETKGVFWRVHSHCRARCGDGCSLARVRVSVFWPWAIVPPLGLSTRALCLHAAWRQRVCGGPHQGIAWACGGHGGGRGAGRECVVRCRLHGWTWRLNLVGAFGRGLGSCSVLHFPHWSVKPPLQPLPAVPVRVSRNVVTCRVNCVRGACWWQSICVRQGSVACSKQWGAVGLVMLVPLALPPLATPSTPSTPPPPPLDFPHPLCPCAVIVVVAALSALVYQSNQSGRPVVSKHTAHRVSWIKRGTGCSHCRGHRRLRQRSPALCCACHLIAVVMVCHGVYQAPPTPTASTTSSASPSSPSADEDDRTAAGSSFVSCFCRCFTTSPTRDFATHPTPVKVCVMVVVVAVALTGTHRRRRAGVPRTSAV